ncbi:MAG: YggS family pyridoxal phosphate-dependent enzyme [Spirochaetaceae bacterium]|jgi:pyridoxal phosphate enzyme (YggS family)|nr:YggS family pyridoxal phosphate-dependent enzyme [Spirochaetaceae bacterium]
MAFENIAPAIASVRDRIGAACARSGRKAEEVRLMGVSKFHPAEAVEAAWKAGLGLFGENRVQEAAGKFSRPGAFRESRPGMELHMIGSLQRNKAKAAVSLFDCIQSVDRDELIAELAKFAPARISGGVAPLGVLLELNAGEESKTGYYNEDALLRGAEKLLSAPGLAARGLMIMAPLTSDIAAIRRAFRSLAALQVKLRTRFPEGDWSCLSMGMSGDFETAIEEGSTLIRIGTAIFGERGK